MGNICDQRIRKLFFKEPLINRFTQLKEFLEQDILQLILGTLMLLRIFVDRPKHV